MSLLDTNSLMIGRKVIIPNVGINRSQHGNKPFPRWEKVGNTIVRKVRTGSSHLSDKESAPFGRGVLLFLHMFEGTFLLVEVLQDIERLLGAPLIGNDSLAVEEVLRAMQLSAWRTEIHQNPWCTA